MFLLYWQKKFNLAKKKVVFFNFLKRALLNFSIKKYIFLNNFLYIKVNFMNLNDNLSNLTFFLTYQNRNFSNIKTSAPLPPTATTATASYIPNSSSLLMKANLITDTSMYKTLTNKPESVEAGFNKMLQNLNKNFIKNESSSIVSPRSDKSDSSLNLNNPSLIVNPLKLSFEDSLNNFSSSSSPSYSTQMHQLSAVQPIQNSVHIQIPKPAQSLANLNKATKSNDFAALASKKKKSSSNKPTVAALLSAYEKNEPIVTKENDSLLSEVSFNNSSQAKAEEVVPIKLNKPAPTKSINKLRDYFSNENGSENEFALSFSSAHNFNFINAENNFKALSQLNNEKVNKLQGDDVPKIKNNKKKENAGEVVKKVKKNNENLPPKTIRNHFNDENELIFEITGEDGFQIQTKDINSKLFFIHLFFLLSKVMVKFKNISNFIVNCNK